MTSRNVLRLNFLSRSLTSSTTKLDFKNAPMRKSIKQMFMIKESNAVLVFLLHKRLIMTNALPVDRNTDYIIYFTNSKRKTHQLLKVSLKLQDMIEETFSNVFVHREPCED